MTELDKKAQETIEGRASKTINLPEGYEMFEGKPQEVINGDRTGWWRFHDHYDRDGYCDNPARGY